MPYSCSNKITQIAMSLVLSFFLISATSKICLAQSNTVETLVIFRHGEKPANDGLGQLTCQGLNRALALPPIFAKMFDPPTALFAPNPSVQIMEGNDGPYSYVRPLTTIEPTAISLVMPVNTQIGYTSISTLQSMVVSSQYASSTVFIAWEHGQITPFAQNVLNSYGGDSTQVPNSWPENDYDTIYVIKITSSGSNNYKSTFTKTSEGITNPSTTCPVPSQ